MVTQILLEFYVRELSESGLNTTRCYRIELAKGNIQEFLKNLPDDIDEISAATLSIRREDGKIVTYADGSDMHGFPKFQRYNKPTFREMDRQSRYGLRYEAFIDAYRYWMLHNSEGVTEANIEGDKPEDDPDFLSFLDYDMRNSLPMKPKRGWPSQDFIDKVKAYREKKFVVEKEE